MSIKRWIAGLGTALALAGCGMDAARHAPTRLGHGVEAAGRSHRGMPTVAPGGGAIRLDSVQSPYVKDPAIVDEGRPIGNRRYIAFGDLRRFYLKAFRSPGRLSRSPMLSFEAGEVPIAIDGLPARIDSPWAPEIVVQGDTVRMLYCAGEMPHPEPPRWATFRLREATAPLARFIAQAKQGQVVHFTDHGVFGDDVRLFGEADTDFGMIDPQLFLNTRGRAFLTYTVVRSGNGQRPHEEFVRYREVAPNQPTRMLSGDMPLYDGFAGTADDGVAEAQEVMTFGKQAYALISSRAGDKDQRLLIAPVPQDLGRVRATDAKPFLTPGGEPWRAKALGSPSLAMIDGKAWMVYQGMNAQGHFSLGWGRVAF